MKRNHGERDIVLIIETIMVGVAIPYLIDDFLFGIPAEFGLSNQGAQVLVGIFAMILIVVFSLVARDHRIGYLGSSCLGGFLA